MTMPHSLLGKRRRPHSVQVFLVREVGGVRSYLLLQRQAMPELGLPAFWQGVTGALEQDESYLDAARREVLEETGIALTAVVETGFSYTFPIRPEWRSSYGPVPSHIEERVFYAVVPETTTPALSREHQVWRWCSLQEAEQLLTFGANVQGLRAVEAHLASNEPFGLRRPRKSGRPVPDEQKGPSHSSSG